MVVDDAAKEVDGQCAHVWNCSQPRKLIIPPVVGVTTSGLRPRAGREPSSGGRHSAAVANGRAYRRPADGLARAWTDAVAAAVVCHASYAIPDPGIISACLPEL